MASTDTLTAEVLRSLVRYEPETGRFFRLQSNNQHPVGSEFSNTLTPRGYRRITVAGRHYMAHRLAWLYVYGEWPSRQIDHENTDRSDNRIQNLRLAEPSQNAANSRTKVTNHLGVKGVRLHECGKYVARIGIEGRILYLGLYETAEAAASAYQAKAVELYGEFARAG